MVLKCTEKDVQCNIVQGFECKDEAELLIDKRRALFAGLSGNEQYPYYKRGIRIVMFFCYPDLDYLHLVFAKHLRLRLLQHFIPVVNMFANACRVSEKLNAFSNEKENLPEERSLLHAIIQNIPDPLYVKDAEGRKILLNKAEAELLGCN